MSYWDILVNGIKKWRIRQNVYEGNLDEVKALNTKSVSGAINTLDPFTFDTETGIGGGTYKHWRILGQLKNYNYQKWEYKDLPDGLDKERIENLLFLWGKCCVFKHSGKYVATNFKPADKNGFNYDYSIKRLIPQPDSPEEQPGMKKELEVGKDCVVIYNDTAFLWGKVYYGKLWRCLDLINEIVGIECQLSSTRILLNQKINVPIGTSQEQKEKINDEWKDTSNIVSEVNLPKKPGNTDTATGNLLIFEDRLDTLWNTYYNTWNLLKEVNGMTTNANVDKKERQINKEISTMNILSNSVNNVELQFRELFCDEMKKVFKVDIKITLKQEEQDLEKQPKQDEEKTDKIDNNE